jgi:hypothetical protein
MNAKNILIAGSAGGAVLVFLLMIFSKLSTIIAPYDNADSVAYGQWTISS